MKMVDPHVWSASLRGLVDPVMLAWGQASGLYSPVLMSKSSARKIHWRWREQCFQTQLPWLINQWFSLINNATRMWNVALSVSYWLFAAVVQSLLVAQSSRAAMTWSARATRRSSPAWPSAASRPRPSDGWKGRKNWQVRRRIASLASPHMCPYAPTFCATEHDRMERRTPCIQ